MTSRPCLYKTLARAPLLLLLVACAFSIGAAARRQPQPSPPFPLRSYRRFVHNLYVNADTNHDGSISKQEAYEMVLKLYIHVNRQAPIPPPTRQTVERLFAVADVTRNNRITRKEFAGLAELVGRRALARVVVCRSMDFVVAPLLARYLVEETGLIQWLQDHVSEGWGRQLVANRNVVKIAMIVTLVNTLGKTVMGLMNYLLDALLPAQ